MDNDGSEDASESRELPAEQVVLSVDFALEVLAALESGRDFGREVVIDESEKWERCLAYKQKVTQREYLRIFDALERMTVMLNVDRASAHVINGTVFSVEYKGGATP